jgi:hypothetical protein
MAAEFYITFDDVNWFNINSKEIEGQIVSLNTFINTDNNIFGLRGIESSDNPYFDVRIIMQYADYILLEINFHPPSIEQSLKQFLNWLRTQTSISIKDEDGELSNW